jgi:hypothetical protein
LLACSREGLLVLGLGELKSCCYLLAVDGQN